jgi:hypothetical protein
MKYKKMSSGETPNIRHIPFQCLKIIKEYISRIDVTPIIAANIKKSMGILHLLIMPL